MMGRKFLVLTDFVLELLNPVGAWHLGNDWQVKSKIFCQMPRPYTKATQTKLKPGKFQLRSRMENLELTLLIDTIGI
jgi:hypothetical protein